MFYFFESRFFSSIVSIASYAIISEESNSERREREVCERCRRSYAVERKAIDWTAKISVTPFTILFSELTAVNRKREGNFSTHFCDSYS